MVPSRKKHEPRSVFDVRETKNWWHGKTLDLKPKFRIRHPWLTTLAGFFLVIIILVGVRRLFVRAEISDFSPASCLGTWQSPEKAQGQPESLSAGVPIDATDSAVTNGATGQIFCGTFVPPNTDETGDITSVGLTLVWNITGLPAVSTTTTPSSTVPADVTSTTDAPSSPLALFVASAHAQDAAAQDATQTDVLASDTSTSVATVDTSTVADTGTVILGPPLSATLAPVESSSESSSASSSADIVPDVATDTAQTSTAPIALPPPAPPAPDDNFLLVSYSMDGSVWTPLQEVNANNWQNLTLSLPLSSWSDIEKLQIKIEGIPNTLAVMPQVSLDGMYMEVHYDVPPILASNNNANDNTSSSATVVTVGPNVTLEIPPKGPLPFVPPPTVVGITKTEDTVEVTVQYVGDFYGTPINFFMYPMGTAASRNGPEGAYIFAGTPPEGPSVNALPLDAELFDPITKQAVVEVVAPVGIDGQSISADAMTTGTYVVDMAYYDSQAWNLTSPQTFTWP